MNNKSPEEIKKLCTERKMIYSLDIQIEQDAIGGLPMSNPFMTFVSNKYQEPFATNTVRFDLFVKWINDIYNDHQSKKAKDGYRNLCELFGSIMHTLNEEILKDEQVK